jgi:hypothetical protein
MLRDIDFGPARHTFIKEKTNEQWIKNLFCGVDTIIVGNRPFHFLLCSNSQLRDRSFWFHAPYENYRAHDIRQWMGDFSDEKSVATRIARMALTLTYTTATITVIDKASFSILNLKKSWSFFCSFCLTKLNLSTTYTMLTTENLRTELVKFLRWPYEK